MKKTPIRISGLSLVAVALTLLTSCNDDNLFQLTGDMSALAFATAVPAASTDAAAASAPTVYHVMDAIEVEGDSLYLVYTVSDLDTIATQPTGSRGTPVDGTNLYSVCGSLNVSAFLGGDITKPLKETDEYGVTLTNAGSFINIAYGPSMDGTSQETYDGDPVWQLDGGIDNYYWPKNNSLAFYAYATATASTTWSGLTTDNFKSSSKIVFDYTVPTGKTNALSQRVDAEHQPDILVTSTLPMPRSSSSIKDYTKGSDKFALVPLTFYHPLCQISFKANPSTSNKLKTDIVLNTITLSKLKGSGTCTFNPAATGTKSADKVTWDFTGVTGTASYTQTYDYDNKDGIVGDTIGTDAQHFMLIPQSLGGPSTGATVGDSPEATVSIGYTTSKGTKKTASFDLHKKKATTAFEWMAGRHYTYVLTGDLTSLTLDGSLLSWDTNQSALGLRHYVLTVTGPGGSDPVLTYNDPLDEQDRGFELASYYYEGEDDSEVNNRTPVIFTMEYQDGTGEWHSFTPEAGILSSSSGEPYLSSQTAYLNGSSFQDLHFGLSSFMDDSQPIAAIQPLRESKKYMLSANRAVASAGSVPLLQDCVDKDPHLWDDEIYGYNTANNANNWDLSRMDIGCELPSTGYNGSATRNSANCYIVRRPGTYKFPVVYGNGLKGGSTSAAGGFTNTVPNGQEPIHLENFINALGEEIFTVTDDHGTKVVAEKNLKDVWILTDMKDKKVTVGAQNVKITDHAKAALLWTDAQETVGGTTQQLISSVALAKKDNDDYISFSTADNKHLVEGNAVIVLYFDADNDNTFEPDDNDFALWSWHIWVTDEHFAPSNLAEITVTPGTITGSTHTYAGTYHFMTMDLGECDNPSKLYTMKADWRKEFQIRFKQVEGNAGYQYLTIKMPDMERPTAPNALYYQWGRKDPFPGKTNADAASTDPKPYYYLGSTTATTTVNAIADPGKWYTNFSYNMPAEIKQKSLPSIKESIRRPSYFLTAAGEAGIGYGRYSINLWNLKIPITDSNDNNEKSDACVYTSVTKTIYDPCPYGYVVPNLKSMFSLIESVSRTNASTYVLADPILAPSTFWYGCIFNTDDLTQDQNLVFPAYGARNKTDGAVQFTNFNYRMTSSNPSAYFGIQLPKGKTTNATTYTSDTDYAEPIRPMLESDNN